MSERGRGRGGRGRGRGGGGGQDDGAATKSAQPSGPVTVIVSQFQQYSVAYDDINDRRERLVKRSRDITIGSKRLIFLLHRIWDSPKDEIRAQATPALAKIKDDIQAIQLELKENAYWKYEPAFSPGFQEFIESISFLHYLLYENLVSIPEINTALVSPELPGFSISLKDYILGIADLTGECMRLAVTSAAKGNMDLCKRIRKFLSDIHNSFVFLSSTVDVRDLAGKIEVMAQSLAKVDQVCFKVTVRRGEFPEEDFKFVDDDQGPAE